VSEELGPRKLAAIMSIDVAGYSALSEIDEISAADLVTKLRTVLAQVAPAQGGQEAGVIGAAALVFANRL